jgi:hypothetical protein
LETSAIGSSTARAALVTLALTAVLGGCSSGDQLGSSRGSGGSGGVDGGSGGAGGGEALAMFALDFQNAFCAPYVACGVYADVATCEAVDDFASGPYMHGILASVASGHTVYDPVAAAACIAALPQDCSVNWNGGVAALYALESISACVQTFIGTLPPGAECDPNALECDPSSSCAADTSCSGTCVSNPSAGPPIPVENFCLGVAACALLPGHLASCDPASSHPCRYLDDYCGVADGSTAMTCLPRLAPGTPCTLPYDPSVGGPCLPGSEWCDPCLPVSRCTSGANGSVCVPFAVLGGPCGTAAPCPGLLVCTNGICVAPTETLCGFTWTR